MELETFSNPLEGLELDDRQTEAIAYLISSPAYTEVFEPIMAALERSMVESLVDPSQARKWSKNDDYLRGGIITIRAIRNFPKAIVADARERDLEEFRTKSVEDHYVERANSGAIGPLGINYDPNTDF